jgi:hypothetical protein
MEFLTGLRETRKSISACDLSLDQWKTSKSPRRRGLYALSQAGPWKGAGPSVDYSWCFEALRNKIETTDWHSTAEDVRRALRAEI